MNRVYALTPFVGGECLGIGVFGNEEQARSAQAALTSFVESEGESVVWQDHGWLTEEEAEDVALRQVLASLLNYVDPDEQ